MENKHSTSGYAEDIIRSFVQIACAELHAKTEAEKVISEIENGYKDPSAENLEKVESCKDDCMILASIRRDQMLYLYEMFGSKGDKSEWCMVKHLAMAMYTAFEAWQGSDNDPELFTIYKEINENFVVHMTSFLGMEVSHCAACFSDMLKGGGEDAASSM